MIDIHTHILPMMDDGSASPEESTLMLSSLKKQGVNEVILSSHFYAEDESPDEYLARRDASFKMLRDELSGKENFPKMRLGAEVCYYTGISRLENKKALCIEGTPLFLLELPLWQTLPQSTIAEAMSIARGNEVILLLAHIDRYIQFNPISVFEDLVNAGALIQINADFICDKHNKRLIKKLNKRGWPHFVGTDCHNMTSRKPNYLQAMESLEKYFGNEATGRLRYYEEAYFG